MLLRHTRNDKHILSFVAVVTEELSMLSQTVTFYPVTNIPQYVYSLPNNSVLWITCLIKNASHLPEQAFTRESVSGGELLHTSFAKKAKRKK